MSRLAPSGRRWPFPQLVLPEAHFEGAAANVQVEDGVGTPPIPAADGEKRHGRFLAAGEFLQRDGGFMLDARQYRGSVGGLADG